MRQSPNARLLVTVACVGTVAFEYHPDHTTCEGAEIAISSMEALDSWPLDKPLRCLWSTGVIASPHVNGKFDHAVASCHIAEFLSKLHHPEELRAIKLYMQDFHAPCFDKYINDHKMFFPKLQILHLVTTMQSRGANGDVWTTSTRMTNIMQLRELVVTSFALHQEDLLRFPVMHHLEVFGLEIDIVYPDGPAFLQLMMKRAPNVLNVHLGGALIGAYGGTNKMAMDIKTLWERCPADVGSGVTTLSLNSNKLHVKGLFEIGHVLKALPSLRKLSMGRFMMLGAEPMESFTKVVENMNHPLPHFHFHIHDQCSYTYKGSVLYTRCLDGLSTMLTALPDLSEITTNYNDPELQLGEDFEELIDDSIEIHTFKAKEHIYEWGAHPPDLHPPIEEHLTDATTELRAPEERAMNLTELRAHKNATRGRSMNLPPKPEKQGWHISFEERVKAEMDKPWLADLKHTEKVQEFHSDPIDRRETAHNSIKHGESPIYHRPGLFAAGEL